MDKLVVTNSIANLTASDRYQDDINNEDYSRKEGSWQDDCEADDRREARSTVTVAFGPIQLEVAPSAEEGKNGNDQGDKGESASDWV